jgi:hypothetical protein
LPAVTLGPTKYVRCLKVLYFHIHDTYLNEIKHDDIHLECVLRYSVSVQTHSCVYDIMVSIAAVSLGFKVSTQSTRLHKVHFLCVPRKNISSSVKFWGLSYYKIESPLPNQQCENLSFRTARRMLLKRGSVPSCWKPISSSSSCGKTKFSLNIL